MEPFSRIEPEDFLKKLEQDGLQDALFLDVREPFEWEYYHLDEAELMPMNTVPLRLSELPQDKTIFVVCAHGVRSANVCYYLKQKGFEHATNVEGGMAALAQLRGFQYD